MSRISTPPETRQIKQWREMRLFGCVELMATHSLTHSLPCKHTSSCPPGRASLHIVSTSLCTHTPTHAGDSRQNNTFATTLSLHSHATTAFYSSFHLSIHPSIPPPPPRPRPTKLSSLNPQSRQRLPGRVGTRFEDGGLRLFFFFSF